MADPTSSSANGLPDVFQDNVADRSEPPSGKFLQWLLSGADTRGPASLVRQLGSGPHNAAPGSHTHDGSDSQYMFGPTPALSPLPATATNAQIVQAINAIITHLVAHGAGVTRS